MFQFVKGSDGHSQMFYKQWHADKWEPSDGVGETLLKVSMFYSSIVKSHATLSVNCQCGCLPITVGDQQS